MLPYPHFPVIPTIPTVIATIDALSKSDSIQNLKITDLSGHLLFDSTYPALLAGVEDNDDDDTSLTEFRQPIQVQSHLEMPGILVQLGHIQHT